MNKKFSRIFSLALVLMLCIAMAIPAFAIGELTTGSGSITIQKKLHVGDAAVPGVTFNYTLAAAQGTFEAPDYAGAVPDGAGTYTAEFTGSETATGGVATKEFSIDFTGFTFEKMGTYHYVLTETAPSSPFDYTDGENGTRYIDVHVVYDDDDNLVIQNVVMYTDNANSENTKSDHFDNDYDTFNLGADKTVTGNQGDRTKHFTFTVTVNNPITAGVTYPEQYDVVFNGVNDCTDEDAIHAPNTKITAGTALTITLKHGESFKIENLPKGATYTIVETTEGYTATHTQTGDAVVSQTGLGEGNHGVQNPEDGLASDTQVSFTNNKDGNVPTGILLTIAPFAALTVIGVAGALFVVLRKRGSVQ